MHNEPLNLSQQLDQAVDHQLLGRSLSTFRYYWGLYKRAFPRYDIQGSYYSFDPEAAYGNVVVLSGGKIIDIDGGDENGSGYLGIQDLASIGSVNFYRGQIEGLEHSQGASLVAFTRLVGETNAGPYWVARTEHEEERLIAFTRLLVDSMNTASWDGSLK